MVARENFNSRRLSVPKEYMIEKDQIKFGHEVAEYFEKNYKLPKPNTGMWLQGKQGIEFFLYRNQLDKELSDTMLLVKVSWDTVGDSTPKQVAEQFMDELDDFYENEYQPE